MRLPDMKAQNIQDAIKAVDSGGEIVPLRNRSNKFCLEYPGTRYLHFPPKEILRIAYRTSNGTELGKFSGDRKSVV